MMERLLELGSKLVGTELAFETIVALKSYTCLNVIQACEGHFIRE